MLVVCRDCGESKDLEADYYAGYAHCKKCQNRRTVESQRKNPLGVKQRTQKWYIKMKSNPQSWQMYLERKRASRKKNVA